MKLKNTYLLILIIVILLCLYILFNNIQIENFEDNEPKIAFITSIFGSYELSCKKFKKQTIPADFICFTNNDNIINNGWIIDTREYHKINKSKLDNDSYINSLVNNTHTFNIAKYYKQAFQNIPRLQKYDVIVWLDGTIEITNENVAEWILNNINRHKIIGWNHEERYGNLKSEVIASNTDKYTNTNWNNQKQPYQDVMKQYESYLNNGYNEYFFKNINHPNQHFGVWVTCFVAFLNKDKSVTDFLNEWYLHTLMHTTQDQVSFSYVTQKLNLIPYTLPDIDINGDKPHENTDFYIKHNHGK